MARAFLYQSLRLLSVTALCLVPVFELEPASAQQSYLGTCDPEMNIESDRQYRGEYFKYECKRGDGSIGWYNLGTKIGAGLPIISIHERNTPNAHFYVKTTNVYPGYFCYYNENDGLERPSEACKKQIAEQSMEPPQRISADCNKQTVSIITELYRFPSTRMAGGYEDNIAEAFRILCPAKFAASGVNPPYKYIPLPSAPTVTPKATSPSSRSTLSMGPSTHPGLGPAFATSGLNDSMRTTKKYHQAIIDSMRVGKSGFGHDVVQMRVLSYEPGSTKGFIFWLSVNCSTRLWTFLENDAKLMGGGVEMFGVIKGNEMGTWACGRYGLRY
jgi:hypothetical protein